MLRDALLRAAVAGSRWAPGPRQSPRARWGRWRPRAARTCRLFFLSSTLGLAVITTVLQRRLTYHSSVLDQQQAFSPLSWEDMLAPVRELVQQTGASGQLGDTQVMALLQRHLEQQATVAAYQDCFLLVTFQGLVCMPLVLLLRKPAT